MTPPLAWVLNLHAELELARPGYNPPAKVLEQIERHGAGSRALLGPDDRLVTPETRGAAGCVGRAWCPTPQAVARLRAAGATPEPHPDVAVLRRANHRRFAHELGGSLAGQRYVESRAELDAAFASLPAPWLLKRPLGFAGRGQLRVYSRERINEKEWQWIEASLRDEGFVVEPLVELVLEVSQHGFLFLDGRLEMGRPCVQGVTDRGVFREIRLAAPGELADAEVRALADACERAGRALREAGYFGPYGIDAHRHRLGGREAFCALSELNARYTMGFATGFPRHPSGLRLDAAAP